MSVAFWLHHGSFGLLLCPALSDEMILVKASSIQEFLAVVHAEHGVRFRGLVPSGTGGFELIETRRDDVVR